MRLPLSKYGFATVDVPNDEGLPPVRLDLRNDPPELQGLVRYVTLIAQQGNDAAELRLRDERGDTEVASLPWTDAQKPLLSRFPVRGPLQLEVAQEGSTFPATGWVEIESGAGEDQLQLRSPLVRGVGNAGVVLCHLPAGIHEVTVYAGTNVQADLIFLTYTPDAAPDAVMQLRGDMNVFTSLNVGFQPLLQRVPVVGPGVLKFIGPSTCVAYCFTTTS